MTRAATGERPEWEGASAGVQFSGGGPHSDSGAEPTGFGGSHFPAAGVGADPDARKAQDNSDVSAATGLARKRLGFDIAVLAVYAAAANPLLTGIPVHEWAGLGAFVFLAAHCASRGMWRGATGKGAGLTVLNVLVLGCLALCVVSGVMVSGTVLAAFGLYADGYYFWDPLHAVAAKVLLALLLVHVAVHIPWILQVVKR